MYQSRNESPFHRLLSSIPILRFTWIQFDERPVIGREGLLKIAEVENKEADFTIQLYENRCCYYSERPLVQVRLFSRLTGLAMGLTLEKILAFET